MVELMVTVAVASVAVIGITTAFAGLSRVAYVQEGFRGGQSSVRSTAQQLTRKLRLAGYGIEPELAFDFPSTAGGFSSGWSDDAARNRSDWLTFRYREPTFGRPVSSATDDTTFAITGSLGTTLPAGAIVQLVCPGASKWVYGVVNAEVSGTALNPSITLKPATGTFPSTNGELDDPCFDGVGSLSAYLYRINVESYRVVLLDHDAVPATPTRPYLFRSGQPDPANTGLGEPVADEIEALRVQFIRQDGTLFTPDPTETPPTYATPRNDPLRSNDHPANIRAVKLGVVGRASIVDVERRTAGLEDTIPAFLGRPALTAPAGYQRLLFEATVATPNLRAREMFIPPYTEDAVACQGAKPTDGKNCITG
jgi:type IV pilus assembly protein PilW